MFPWGILEKIVERPTNPKVLFYDSFVESKAVRGIYKERLPVDFVCSCDPIHFFVSFPAIFLMISKIQAVEY